MVLKFHMHHDQTAGLQTDKIQPDQESKMVVNTEDSNTNKSTFSPEPFGLFD